MLCINTWEYKNLYYALNLFSAFFRAQDFIEFSFYCLFRVCKTSTFNIFILLYFFNLLMQLTCLPNFWYLRSEFILVTMLKLFTPICNKRWRNLVFLLVQKSRINFYKLSNNFYSIHVSFVVTSVDSNSIYHLSIHKENYFFKTSKALLKCY